MSQERERHYRATVEIFGEEYVIRGERHPQQIRRLAARVDACMRKLAQRSPQAGAGRIAVLAALNLAGELAALEGKYERLLAMLEEEWQRRAHAPAAGEGSPARPRRAAPENRRDGTGAGEQVPLPTLPVRPADEETAEEPGA